MAVYALTTLPNATTWQTGHDLFLIQSFRQHSDLLGHWLHLERHIVEGKGLDFGASPGDLPFERVPKGQVTEGCMLFLTRGPYALLRFPQFCLREIPVFGYAYAVLTRSLWMRFSCTKMQRDLTHEAFLIAATPSEQQIRTKKTKKMRMRNQLSKRGVAVFSSRLCLASNCRNGFSLGGIVGK